MSARDAARLLGLSHQRVHQLAQDSAKRVESRFRQKEVVSVVTVAVRSGKLLLVRSGGAACTLSALPDCEWLMPFHRGWPSRISALMRPEARISIAPRQSLGLRLSHEENAWARIKLNASAS
jgi:hypothetical protein